MTDRFSYGYFAGVVQGVITTYLIYVLEWPQPWIAQFFFIVITGLVTSILGRVLWDLVNKPWQD